MTLKKRFNISTWLTTIFTLVMLISMNAMYINAAFAQDIPRGGGFVPPPEERIEDTIDEPDIRKLTVDVTQYFLGFLGLAAVVVLIYGGLLMVFSGGDEEGYTKGKNVVLYAGIGIILILAAYTIVNWIIGASVFVETGEDLHTGAGIQRPAFHVTQSGNIRSGIGSLTRSVPPGTDLTREVVEIFTDDRLALFLEGLDRLRAEVVAFFSRVPPTPENLLARDEILSLIDAVALDPRRIDLLEEALLLFEAFELGIANLPILTANITATPSRGSAPLTVVLDGTGSIDPTATTIPDSNYGWSYVDNTGVLRTLESKSITTATFDEPGKYVINLIVSTAAVGPDGFKAAIDGGAAIDVFVEPPKADVSFTINGADVFDVYSVTLAEAQAGLSFDPAESRSTIGRSFTQFKWNFGDTVTEERLGPSVIEHFYNQEGSYDVRLEITDNAGEVFGKVITLQVKAIAAKMIIDPAVGDTSTLFVLDASQSAAMDGQITEYLWEILQDGVIVDSFAEQIVNYQFPAPGTYQVTLLVTDATGNQDRATVLFDVLSQPPVSFFDVFPLSPAKPSTFVFNNDGTIDPDGDAILFDWDFDGDGSFEIVDSKDREVIHSFASPGSFITKMVAKDSFGGVAVTEREVIVQSVLDIEVGLSPAAAPVGTTIGFGAVSPLASSFEWNFGDGTVVQTDTPQTSHRYTQAGVFEVLVTAFDTENNQTTIRRRAFISEANTPLAIIATAINDRELLIQDNLCGPGRHGIEVTRRDLVTFDAALSLNIDGSTRGLGYNWSFGDDGVGSDKRMLHRYTELNPNNQCYEVRLTVQDQATGAVAESLPLYVNVINKAPSFSKLLVLPPNKDTLVTPVPVNLEIIAPYDSDGNISGYRFWYYYRDSKEKFELQTTTKPKSVLTVLPRGQSGIEHEVLFAAEVIDNDGARSSNLSLGLPEMPVTIKNGDNLPPEVSIRVDKTTINTGDSITFFAEAEDPQGIDIPESNYRWDFDGDGQYEDQDSGSQVSRNYNIPGEYEVRVKVTSRQGLSTTASQKIFVERVNEFPKAAFVFQTNGLNVSFDATNSQLDPSIPNNALRYEWDFNLFEDSDGDGDPANDVDSTDRFPQHRYTSKSSYQVQLRVTDILRSTDTVTRKVDLNLKTAAPQKKTSPVISSPSHGVTTLDVSVDNKFVKPGQSTSLNAIVSNADGSAYNGVVTFTLREGSAQIDAGQIQARQSAARNVLHILGRGTIEIEIEARDTAHGTLRETLTFTVQ